LRAYTIGLPLKWFRGKEPPRRYRNPWKRRSREHHGRHGLLGSKTTSMLSAPFIMTSPTT